MQDGETAVQTQWEKMEEAETVWVTDQVQVWELGKDRKNSKTLTLRDYLVLPSN